MRGCVHASRTMKDLVADLRHITNICGIMYRVYAESCSFNIDYTIGLHPNFELGIILGFACDCELFSLNWQFWQKNMSFWQEDMRTGFILSIQNWRTHNAPWRTIQNSKFLIPNSDGVRRPLANIVQTVKNCYKIKIGFRDFASRFSAVLLRLWHPDLSIQPLLHSNSSPIR